MGKRPSFKMLQWSTEEENTYKNTGIYYILLPTELRKEGSAEINTRNPLKYT